LARRDEILAYADELLEVERFPEYGPAGAQVLGAEEVRKIVCGVSSSLELFRRAEEAGAQLVLVHHGIFWRNEPLVVDRRQRARLQALFDADLTLAAYHIALDAHPEVGNNAQLAGRLGIEVDRRFEGIAVGGALREPLGIDELAARVERVVEREPLHLPGGPDRIERVAVATGASGHSLIAAARAGYDVLVTGEAEEPNAQMAQELGIHLIAAGHYATERLGVQALSARLAGEFDLEWEFVDLPVPV
jgi:dinuclear metal center YbgI/SA1388 family protein